MVASQPLSVDELRRDGGRARARRDRAVAARRALPRGTQRHRARARRRRLRLPGGARCGRGLLAAVRQAGGAGALAGGARDARDRRVPRPVHAPGDRPDPRAWPRTPRSRGSSSAGCSARRAGRPPRRGRPLPHDAALRARLRARAASPSCRGSRSSAATPRRSARGCTRWRNAAPPELRQDRDRHRRGLGDRRATDARARGKGDAASSRPTRGGTGRVSMKLVALGDGAVTAVCRRRHERGGLEAGRRDQPARWTSSSTTPAATDRRIFPTTASRTLAARCWTSTSAG